MQLVERDAAPLASRHAAHPQPELDVVGDVEPGHQRVLLEHDAALGAGTGHALAVEHDLARRVLHEAGDARQERRLAAARRAERDDEVAGVERQVDVGERVRRPSAAAGVVDARGGGLRACSRECFVLRHEKGASNVGGPTLRRAESSRRSATRQIYFAASCA